MSSPQRRFGAHISEAAREALAACEVYPHPDAFLNPLTRAVAREFADRQWRAALDHIDFPYTIDDVTIDDSPCAHYTTRRTSASNPLLLYIHAGAFVAGSPRVNAATILPVCEASACEAIGIDYSLAPEATYPAQIDEIERVYRGLLRGGVAPSRIVVLGDSAGGALALASLVRWRAAGLPVPAGVGLWSPVTDGAGESDTMLTLAGHDPLFGGDIVDGMARIFSAYAPGQDVRRPDVSPIYADYRGAPPMLIHVGSREVLLGDSARLAERARRAGVDVTLRVFDGMFHLFHMQQRLEEARASVADMAAFIARVAAVDARAAARTA